MKRLVLLFIGIALSLNVYSQSFEQGKWGVGPYLSVGLTSLKSAEDDFIFDDMGINYRVGAEAFYGLNDYFGLGFGANFGQFFTIDAFATEISIPISFDFYIRGNYSIGLGLMPQYMIGIKHKEDMFDGFDGYKKVANFNKTNTFAFIEFKKPVYRYFTTRDRSSLFKESAGSKSILRIGYSIAPYAYSPHLGSGIVKRSANRILIEGGVMLDIIELLDGGSSPKGGRRR